MSENITELLFKTYGTVLPEQSSIYLSTPISSGKPYINWLKKINKKYDSSDNIDFAVKSEVDSYKEEVIKVNKKSAQELAKKIRSQQKTPVINPADMADISIWKQPEWLNFWEKIIKTYANFVVFANGWEYSNGCTFEFFVAQSHGICCYDEQLNTLDLGKGIDFITKAIATLKTNDGVTKKLESNLALLISINTKNA